MSETVMIAAGGTGGHVFPGLATAAALMRAHPDLTVEFVGTAERLEATLVPEAGYTLHTVPAMALSRKVSVSTLKLPGLLLGAVRQVRGLLRDRDVVAAVGFGGYTSVPLALAARSAKVPLVVHEQNAVPGLANRLAARAAVTVAVTFAEAMDGFGSTPTVLTGNPVRPGLIPGMGEGGADLGSRSREMRPEAIDAFGLDPNRRTLLVFGGSQGAKRINQALTGSVGGWSDPGDVQVLHAAGRQTFGATRKEWESSGVDPDGNDGDGSLKVLCVEFIEQMHLAYAVADLVVCRAGASSIAELTALGLPAILVPYPHATADHQTANARAVADVGGAIRIADSDVTAATVIGAVQPLLGDVSKLQAMAGAAADFGRPQAAVDLAALVATAGGL